MATSTPVIQKAGSVAPTRSYSRSDTRAVVSFTVGTYATGGAPLTLPDEVKGLRLIGVNILTPISPTGAIRYYSWNGDAAAPKVYATVASTGAQVANDVDLSAVTLLAELIFAQ